MRTVLWTGWCAAWLGSVALAQEPVTRPATEPTTQAATVPTTAATTGPATLSTTGPATTQALSQAEREARRLERDERRRDEARRKEEDARLNAVLAGIPAEAELADSEISSITSKFAADPVTGDVDNVLWDLLGEIGPRLEENDRLLTPATSLDDLGALEDDWKQYARALDQWSDELRRRDAFLVDSIKKLDAIVESWRQRRRLMRDATTRPGAATQPNADAVAQLFTRSGSARDQAQKLLDNLNWEQARATNLTITMSAAKTRVRNALTAVQDAQAKARSRLFVKDSPTLWYALLHAGSQENVAEQGRNTMANQWAVLKNYLTRQKSSLLLHLAGVMALAAGLIWLRRQTRQWTANDPTLSVATRVFQTPIATAITVSMILAPWIYIAAPRLFWGIVGTSALIPTILVLRPLIKPVFVPLLYALAVASLLNLLLSIVAAMPLAVRFVLLLEMGGAAAFFFWFLRSRRGVAGDPQRPPLDRIVVIGLRLGILITLAAVAANLLGFVALARLIGGALITSAYLGVLLDTSVHVIDALLLGASHVRPISSLGMVQRHRPLLLHRLHLLVSLLAIGAWIYFTLEALSIRTTLLGWATTVWNAQASAIGIHLSLGNVIAFCLTLAASLYVTRFIGFVLDEDVYPRLRLARGLPYAISTLVRYVVLALGFSLAMAKLGYGDMTQFTILASAFGIGLGFGLQNIVNNFVSGLILLFERPVQVGDVIELDNITGVVSRIGIRASIIRTSLAAEIIVPNGRLISDRVVNWTLSNRQRGVELPVTVAGGTDPQKMIALLTSTAKAHPLVAAYPGPQAYFTDFGGGGMKFEVRAWTNRFEDWSQVRSELAVAINAALTKENISLK